MPKDLFYITVGLIFHIKNQGYYKQGRSFSLQTLRYFLRSVIFFSKRKKCFLLHCIFFLSFLFFTGHSDLFLLNRWFVKTSDFRQGSNILFFSFSLCVSSVVALKVLSALRFILTQIFYTTPVVWEQKQSFYVISGIDASLAI